MDQAVPGWPRLCAKARASVRFLQARVKTLENKVLVTGGAGFIGSHLVEELVRRGRTVRILDNFSTGSRDNLSAVADSSAVDIRVGDAADPEAVRSALAGCDTIFHLAASVGVGTVTDDPLGSLENNIDSVRTLFGLLRSGSPVSRVVYFSSSEVYGKSSTERLEETSPFIIGPADAPRWSYAAAKITGEYLALGSSRQHGVPTTVVRCFNTAGPRQVDTYGMVIPRFFRQALAGEPLTVYGDGSQTRCFSFVGDVVASVLDLAQHPGAVGEVFNVGSDEAVSVLELAHQIRSMTGSRSEISFVPFETAYGPGFEESPHRRPSLSKLRSFTNRNDQTPLEEILSSIHGWLTQRADAGGDATADVAAEAGGTADSACADDSARTADSASTADSDLTDSRTGAPVERAARLGLRTSAGSSPAV